MREHVQMASRRRDQHLVQIRKITLWITGGAAAAALGLSTVFAHAVPGHAASTTSTARPSATPSASATSGSANSGSANSGSAHSGSTSTGGSASTGLSQPQQRPTHTTGPSSVTSGGS